MTAGIQKDTLAPDTQGFVGHMGGSHSPVHSQLGRAQLASSLPTSLQPRPFQPQHTPQNRLSGAQLGSSWGSVDSQSASYQVPLQPGSNENSQGSGLGYSNLSTYNTHVVNGQMAAGMHLQQDMQYQNQLQFDSMGFMSMQSQQMQYGGFTQLQQTFPQETNGFQYNVDYIDSADPNAYQDYYYDYQYNSYNGSMDSLDPNYLGTPVGRAPTPYGDETVDDLGPEEVRWFYKIEADKKWTPFIGYDSLRIEWKYRDLMQDTNPGGSNGSPYGNVENEQQSPKEMQEKSQVTERIVVRGGLYEVDVKHRRCESIYWKGMYQAISERFFLFFLWLYTCMQRFERNGPTIQILLENMIIVMK